MLDIAGNNINPELTIALENAFKLFTFVDASHLISKANLWEERDEARKQKYEKLNNETMPEVAYDQQAKIGCKGGSKFWYGYKKHVSVDIQSGLTNKVAVTPANIADARGIAHVLPSGRRSLR
ncbi:MAG: transposase [Rickettsiales bacterium]